MVHKKFYLNRYFWVTNVFFGLAVHGIFVHVEYGSARQIGSELSWTRTWFLMSPWFVIWIWVTVGILFAVEHIDGVNVSQNKRIFQHVIWLLVLLMSYWAFCSAAGLLIRGGHLSQFWASFIRTLTTSSQIDVLIYFGVLAAVLSFRFYHKSIQESIELKRALHELTQEQLRTLRSQLNPHFLFNASNTVASLVRLNEKKTRCLHYQN